MFETNDCWRSQQHSPLESSALGSHMNAPINIRQHEVLSASIKSSKLVANSGFDEFGIPVWSEKDFSLGGIDSVKKSGVYSPISTCTPEGSPLEQVTLHQRKYLIFDQSRNETRVMFSSLRSGLQNMPARPTECSLWNPQVASSKLFDAYKCFPEREARKDEQMCATTLDPFEGSGENENWDEECDMREDTEEINALLYSDDYDDQDNDFNDEDDDEVSSGHSPLIREEVCHKQEVKHESDFDDEAAISSISFKKRKVLDNGDEKLGLIDTTITRKENMVSENIHSEDFSSAIEKGSGPTIGNKRPRKDKIRDTLKVLESIIPGLNSEDPVLILDEAIRYLQCLKCDAETMFAEDIDNCTCNEPVNKPPSSFIPY
ncbi:hypothetical protein vseg_007072 [Gypsophila vaccaria]